MEFDYEKLVSATDGFSPSRLIGKGSHGYVYEGLLHEEHNRVVAIKTPSLSLSRSSQPSSPLITKTEQMKKLEDEIKIMSSLPYNPHVLTFLGHAEKRLMVVEYMPNGSLHQLLHVSSSATPPRPTWLKRIEIALKIARAVHFLHEQGILHRDIKSDNILFDSSWEPKLADFGLAVDLVAEKKAPTAPAGTIGYLDPSYTSPEKLSAKTDVYSYGVVLLEIVSCRKAIDVSRSPASIVDWAVPLIEEGKIGEICGGGGGGGSGVFVETNLRLLRMAARCVSSDVESRPSSGEIAAEMVACLTEPVRRSLPLWISFFRGVVKLKRRKKRLRERMTWPGQTCRVR
ncbi:Serine/threonine-protein kinase-like protein [Raphanus sativus]|uniref:Serine/threonine-protein kinase-like protein At5g23170 n=1 Tax=Raphanus sativus TaxID=3726 RepID=A0A6J0NGC5_RAPSA|nr:serine/threonine-protein kinase-like protein At5g23170 [Raphanus sativus]KAJ4900388.1 Serine/threonine-protein kinase-like protein [Raphanus sativus]